MSRSVSSIDEELRKVRKVLTGTTTTSALRDAITDEEIEIDSPLRHLVREAARVIKFEFGEDLVPEAYRRFRRASAGFWWEEHRTATEDDRLRVRLVVESHVGALVAGTGLSDADRSDVDAPWRYLSRE